MEIIGIILWSILALLAMVQFAPFCGELSEWDKFAVGCILIIGGPILAAANIVEELLNCYLPEGWDSDDTKGY